jgi:hypothetical protein
MELLLVLAAVELLRTSCPANTFPSINTYNGLHGIRGTTQLFIVKEFRKKAKYKGETLKQNQLEVYLQI